MKIYATSVAVLLLAATRLPADEPAYGTYGYRHPELHERGTIDELMRRTGRNCCDGGDGGECRVTTITSIAGRGYFRLGDKWCPINEETSYALLMTIPGDAPAVVCASEKVDPQTGCPYVTYCAGAGGDS